MTMASRCRNKRKYQQRIGLTQQEEATLIVNDFLGSKYLSLEKVGVVWGSS